MNKNDFITYGLFGALSLGAFDSPSFGRVTANITGVNHTSKPFEPTVKPPYKRPKQFKKKRHA